MRSFLLSVRQIFQFQFWPDRRYWHVILGQILRKYRFIKMATADAECYFRFRICWCRCLQKVKVYDQTKFRRHISIDGWDLTTSIFEKKTNDRHIGILLSVLISTTSRNFNVILHHDTEFRPNRSSRCGHITSYLYLKMAAATARPGSRLQKSIWVDLKVPSRVGFIYLSRLPSRIHWQKSLQIGFVPSRLENDLKQNLGS